MSPKGYERADVLILGCRWASGLCGVGVAVILALTSVELPRCVV